MPINIDVFIQEIERKNGYELDDGQKDAISHDTGPLWIIAGPGTGKTEVLVARCLKLIFVDNVKPGSIIVTTFTNHAAKQLEDKILAYYNYFKELYPELGSIDLSDMRIGTLHGLCNEVMQEYKYENWQDLRLLDDIEQKLFIRKNLAQRMKDKALIWGQFSYMVRENRNENRNGYGPNLWEITKATSTLFNKIVEDRIDVPQLQSSGGGFTQLADEYLNYKQYLLDHKRCDFAHLQSIFLDFLSSQQSQVFLNGDEENNIPCVEHILVDEYQDTNPIQEEIYFKLANKAPHNLAVVGDDDQALYRFRAGTVECMVNFPQKCGSSWPSTTANLVQLKNNYRSHPDIVRWINDYIESFPQMEDEGVRSQNKERLEDRSSISGVYPAVGWVSPKRYRDAGFEFVQIVEGLHDNGIIPDYKECALLLPSSKESTRYAGPFVNALRVANIPYYNPRSKAYIEQEEVTTCLGALLSIFDPNFDVGGDNLSPRIRDRARQWMVQYNEISEDYPELEEYVRKSQEVIQSMNVGERITPAMPTILYRIISFEPFIGWQNDPQRDLRISKLTRIFEAYCSIVGRYLFMDDTTPGVINQQWLNDFYYLLIGYLDSTGIDEDEDEEVICPPGRVPIMTIHQAKGLQFPFVFVSSLGWAASPGATHYLESDLNKFRMTPMPYQFSPAEKALHDMVRLYYVAYSRAENALIFIATRNQLAQGNPPAVGGNGFQWFNSKIQRL